MINSSSDRGATDVNVAAHTAHVHALIQAVLLRVGLLWLQAHLMIKTAARAYLNACTRPNIIVMLFLNTLRWRSVSFLTSGSLL